MTRWSNSIAPTAMILRWGAALTPSMQMTVIIVAVSVGGLVALTAAFFGMVMPSSVSGEWDKIAIETARQAMEKKQREGQVE